ncbi:hypothetical protein NM688_g5698 [Phlebia brevispora]|uniref:Uncharacterized protein n=1 Tax=Phlebia brevispora TaxID=194682 RepID=A0ACC1SRA9_9APHY|nr:hypothetical protein NM688_g5698 [Phlebia brevispora]
MDQEEHKVTVAYVVSNELVKVSSLLPSNKNRSLVVHSLIKQLGLLSPENFCETSLRLIPPIPAQHNDLTVYHDRDYVDFILDSGNSSDASEDPRHAEFGIEEDCPAFLGMSNYVRMVAGASLTAARSLVDKTADVAICWDGGRHHTLKSQASGFCYVADCVLAILAMRRSRIVAGDGSIKKPRIMYLDLDLHFSDGVSQAFFSSASGTSSPQVLTLSIHHAAPGFFPASEMASLTDPEGASFDPFTLSLPLERGASDTTFHSVWQSVETIKNAFSPDYVVLQCGVDGLAGDPCGIWNWSLDASDGSLGWCVTRVCSGYNSANAARAWAYLTSIALRKPLPLDADIPDHGAFPMYAPSFTLDVPPGTAQDQNTEYYLRNVAARFEQIASVIKARMT